jgi:hypothetical protein
VQEPLESIGSVGCQRMTAGHRTSMTSTPTGRVVV